MALSTLNRGCFAISALLIATPIAGCSRDAAERPSASKSDAGTLAAEAARSAKVEITAAAPGEDAAVIVRREVDRARADGRDLVVYVGATWCEPCQRLHHAAAAGELDAAFPGLRLLEFDLDRDEPRLRAAGYVSKMIPLLAVPAPDGRATGLQIEGSIKGEGAVGQIAPRLSAMLQKARAGG